MFALTQSWEYGLRLNKHSFQHKTERKQFSVAAAAAAFFSFLHLFFAFRSPTVICVNVMCRCYFDLFSIFFPFWRMCMRLCLSYCRFLFASASESVFFLSFGDRLSLFTWFCVHRTQGILVLQYVLANTIWT